MNRRFTYLHQEWAEFEAGLFELGLSPLAACRLWGIAAGNMRKWQDGQQDVPIWATILVACARYPDARRAMNDENARRLLMDKETGEAFGQATVERMRR